MAKITTSLPSNGGNVVHNQLAGLNEGDFLHLTPEEKDAFELKVNKQDSLAIDGTGIKFPTVDAVIDALNLKQDVVNNSWTNLSDTQPTITPLQTVRGNELGDRLEFYDPNFLFVQSIPSSSWIINHPLRKYPSITIMDSSNNEAKGSIYYQDINTVVVSFNASFSGTATLN